MSDSPLSLRRHQLSSCKQILDNKWHRELSSISIALFMSPPAAPATKPQVIKSLAWLEKSDTGEGVKRKTVGLNLCILYRNRNYSRARDTCVKYSSSLYIRVSQLCIKSAGNPFFHWWCTWVLIKGAIIIHNTKSMRSRAATQTQTCICTHVAGGRQQAWWHVKLPWWCMA